MRERRRSATAWQPSSLLACVALVAACGSGNKDTIVVVALIADPASPGLTSATVTVKHLAPAPLNDVVRTFPIPGGLTAASAVKLGVYLPASLTGPIEVTVVARVSDSCGGGYQGTARSTVDKAGSRVDVPLILRPAVNVCVGDGGVDGPEAGADGGSGGNGGNGSGTGGSGTGGVGSGGNGTGGVGSGGSGTGGVGSGGSGIGGAGSGGRGTGGAGSGGRGPGGTGGAGATGGAGMATGGIGAPPTLTKCTKYDHGDPAVCAARQEYLRVRSLAFAPNGRLFASAAEDGRLKLWNFDGKALTPQGRVLTATAPQFAIAFTPDGTQLLGGVRDSIQRWDTTSWARTQVAAVDGDVYFLRITSDGRYAVTVASGTSYILYRHDLRGISAPIQVETTVDSLRGLALLPTTPSGQHVAIVAMAGGMAAVVDLDAPTLSLANTFPVGMGDLTDLAVTADGMTLAASSATAVRFWRLPLAGGQTSTSMFSIDTGSGASIDEIKFTPGGRQLALAVHDTTLSGTHTALWDLGAAPRSVGRTETGYTPSALAFSPNGTALAIGHLECGAVVLCVD